MWSLVAKLHRTVPVVGSRAYRCESNEPTYTVPSEPIAGEEITYPGVNVCHSDMPDALRW